MFQIVLNLIVWHAPCDGVLNFLGCNRSLLDKKRSSWVPFLSLIFFLLSNKNEKKKKEWTWHCILFYFFWWNILTLYYRNLSMHESDGFLKVKHFSLMLSNKLSTNHYSTHALPRNLIVRQHKKRRSRWRREQEHTNINELSQLTNLVSWFDKILTSNSNFDSLLVFYQLINRIVSLVFLYFVFLL